MERNRIKVAYIAGTGKSGSTLLGKLLGQIDGFTDVGELINIPNQFDHGEKCGCKKPVSECGFWTAVIDESLGEIDKLDRARWRRLKTRYLPMILLPGGRRIVRRYFAQLHEIHKAVNRISDTEVTVDSSKSVFYGAVLNLFDDVDVFTVHLVRDVRGSEGSMHRLKSEGAGKWVGRTTWWNSVRWMIVNLLTEWTARWVDSPYLRVRYEDLVADPRTVLQQITDLVGESAHLGFLSGSTANLALTHTIAGSSVRFKEGPIELRLDERWKDKLPENNLAVVDRLTRRFRRRYGY